MSENLNKPEMAIHKAIKFVMANANLQLMGQETAIPYVVGSPGIGKTVYTKQMAKKFDFDVLPFHFSLMPIEEISGIPKFKEVTYDHKQVSGTEWSLPDIMTKIYEFSANHKKVIIFLDDYHMSSPAHLALGFEMFTERKLRGYKIPNNTAFIIAGNDTVKSGAKQMFGAIVNRFSFYKVFPDFNQWEKDYAIPSGINPKIVTFLKNKVNQAYFLEEESTLEPWASPRAWARFSSMLNAMENISFNDEELLYNAYGHIGGKAASEFVAYYNIYSKTQMDAVFDGKIKVSIPDSAGDIYIYAMAASNEYVNRIIHNDEKSDNKLRQNTIDKVGEIIIGIARSHIDIAVSMIQNIQDYSSSMNRKDGFHLRQVLGTLAKIDKNIDNKLTQSLTEILLCTNK